VGISFYISETKKPKAVMKTSAKIIDFLYSAGVVLAGGVIFGLIILSLVF
jgi:hypothetical protein